MLSGPRGSPAVIPPYIGSPVIDAAPNDANCLPTDQRGVARPVGERCDLGAFEGAIARSSGGGRGVARSTDATSAPPTCETRLSATVTVSGIVPGSECQEVGTGGVGNQAVVDAGLIAAVDVWGYIGAGVTVCFEGQGRVILLDAATSPRTFGALSSRTVDGQTCAWVDRTGTVVLVPQDSSLLPPARVPAAGWSLANCMVTATDLLNLRMGPGDRVIGVVPSGSTLTALARTDDWFEVDYIGTDGWISADYVISVGNCD